MYRRWDHPERRHSQRVFAEGILSLRHAKDHSIEVSFERPSKPLAWNPDKLILNMRSKTLILFLSSVFLKLAPIERLHRSSVMPRHLQAGCTLPTMFDIRGAAGADDRVVDDPTAIFETVSEEVE